MQISSTFQKWFFAFLFLMPSLAFATHNRAGEIHIEYIDDLTRRAMIITYTKASSLTADRKELWLNWGDGKTDTVARVNGTGEMMIGDIKKNIYILTHKYDKYGTYDISTLDPNRNGGILNIAFPMGDLVPFFIKTTILVSNNLKNSTPRLLNPPVDKGIVGIPFKHVVNAFDVDGDSLAYRLAAPMMELNTTATLYEFPNMVKPGSNNKLNFNERTGELNWESPRQAGEYALAIHVISYRNGRAIDTTVRDMQILIEGRTGVLPEMTTTIPQLVEVKPNSEVTLVVKSAAITAGKQVRVSATGGLFEVSNKAVFTGKNTYQTTTSDTFRFKATEANVRAIPYTIVFKVEDNTFDSTGLVNFYILQVKVNALSSSLQEIDNQLISAYPNPTSDNMLLTIDEKMQSDKARVEVYDITGKIVFTTNTVAQSQVSLRKNDIGLGIFFVKMYFEKAQIVSVKKVIFE